MSSTTQENEHIIHTRAVDALLALVNHYVYNPDEEYGRVREYVQQVLDGLNLAGSKIGIRPYVIETWDKRRT